MKRFVLLSTLFVLLISACGTTSAVSPTAIPLPVIQVDSAHMTTVNLVYEIPAGEGFVLDASNYDFGLSGEPTMVQVVMKGGVYQAAWSAETANQTIRAADLEPAGSFPRLAGFTSGQQLIVAIGLLTPKGKFSPLWVGVVNIK